MSVLEWKKINILKVSPCVDSYKLRKIKTEITARCYNGTQKVFCDELGNVHVLFRNWDCVSFPSHSSGVINICAITEENLLSTISQNPISNDVSVQVFNLQKLTKKDGAPLIAVARLTSSSAVVTLQMYLADNILILAIGFENGEIMLHRSTISRDMSCNFRTLAVCQRPIKGISFELKRKTSEVVCNMFVCSNDGIFCYILTENNIDAETKLVLDTKSDFDTHCCTMHYSDGSDDAYFVVGRENAIYCFTRDGRGPCYAIEGTKKCIAWIGNNLFIVVHPYKTSLQQCYQSLLIVVDIQNKMVILNKKFEDIIDCLLIESESCFVITKQAKQLYLIRERDMQSKVRMLVNKNMFEIAIKILNNSEKIKNYAGFINLHFGHYLMQKGDINGAIEKYIETIGLVEPFDIIQLFSDSRHNKYLAAYLQALLHSPHGKEEHRELLYRCNERIELSRKMENQFERKLNNTIMYCCASSKYKIGNDDMDINLDENFIGAIHNGDAFCTPFDNLNRVSLDNLFIELFPELMSKCSQQVTDIFKLLLNQQKVLHPERFISLFLLHENCCKQYLETVIDCMPQCDKKNYNALLEIYLRSWRSNGMDMHEILKFIKLKEKHFDKEQALITCKLYEFWAGIRELLGYQQHTYVNMNNVNNDGKNNFETFSQSLIEKNTSYSCSTTYLNFSLNSFLKRDKQSMLQVLNNISINKNPSVLNIKEFFMQQCLQKNTSCNRRHEISIKLQDRIKKLNMLVTNFKAKPVEFRNSICEICRQILKLPAIFYLCQHSFHKECISNYSSSICAACSLNRDQTDQIKLTQENDNMHMITPSENGNISIISKLIGDNIFNQNKSNTIELKSQSMANNCEMQWPTGNSIIDTVRCTSNSKSKKIIKSISKNPFEEISTNPFE